jgi:hypothetical protein
MSLEDGLPCKFGFVILALLFELKGKLASRVNDRPTLSWSGKGSRKKRRGEATANSFEKCPKFHVRQVHSILMRRPATRAAVSILACRDRSEQV